MSLVSQRRARSYTFPTPTSYASIRTAKSRVSTHIGTTLSGVNYFFGLTTTISPDQRQLLCTGQGRSPAAVWVLLHKIKGLVVGAVGMWESRSDFQGAVGRVENLVLVFQAFHGAVISTALRFSWLIRLRPGFPLADSSWRVPRGNWECSVR
jgi:hypothetical protein